MIRIIYILTLSLLIFTGCSTADDEKVLYVAAASDLYHALTEIGDAFTEETGVEIKYTYGSTGLLTQQIQEGAPFDLFLAAHESYIDRLIERDAVLEDSKKHYSIGRIVLMQSTTEEVDLNIEFLLNDEVKNVAIANPEHAPYGKAAQESLEAWGIWEEIKPKLVYAENIRQAYQYVESGNADVGIIALALMNQTEFQYELIEDDSHEPILQALAIPLQAEHKQLSEDFSDFILSESGQDILKKYGFDIP